MKLLKQVFMTLSLIFLVAAGFALPADSVQAATYTPISKLSDFQKIRENPSGNYRLTKNINLGKAGKWVPIGTEDEPFTGSFDGAGHLLKGIKITGAKDFCGLFGYTSFASIKNLRISGKVKGSSYIGGIVGYGTHTTIKKCLNLCKVVGTNSYCGGIAGQLDNESTMRNCSNQKKITGVNQVGGLVGRISNDSSVINCENTATVCGSGRCTGGIASDIYPNGTIINCNNLGKVKGTELVGGISGGCTDGPIINCNNFGYIVGNYRTGAISGDNAGYAGIRANCYFRKTARINSSYSIVGYNSASYVKASGILSNPVYLSQNTYGRTYNRAQAALNAYVSNYSTKKIPLTKWKLKNGCLRLKNVFN